MDFQIYTLYFQFNRLPAVGRLYRSSNLACFLVAFITMSKGNVLISAPHDVLIIVERSSSIILTFIL